MPHRPSPDRGQTKGQTSAGGQRGEAQAEVGKDEEMKGRKRHRGRRGRTVKGKRPKGDGSSSAAEGSTGTVAAWDGTDSGRKKKNKRKSGCGLASPSHDNGGSGTGEEHESESEGVGGRRRDRVGRADLAGGEEVGIAAPRGEAEEVWRAAHTGSRSKADIEGQEAAEACQLGGAADAGIGRGVGVGGATGQGWQGAWCQGSERIVQK
jgi:hypothetical protein